MIANEKRKDLLDDRADTLLLMQKLATLRPFPKEALQLLGKMARYAKDVVLTCDAEGWEKYYEIKARYTWK